MQLIWQRHGQLKVLDLGQRPTQIVVGAGMLALLLCMLVLASVAIRSNAGLVPLSELEDARQKIANGEARLAAQERRLGAYSARLSRMQAHIIRLDAMGRQLTSMAGLDPTDFAFDQEPPLGGRSPQPSGTELRLAELGADVDAVADALDSRERQIDQLADLLLNRQLAAQVRPDGHPVRSGYISSLFGRRTDPFTGSSMRHKGVDYAGPLGSPIVAVADGVVAQSRYYGGFGNFVEINHGQGYVTRYAHNQENLVQPGERVSRGQSIALLGATGRATGPNLHFEVLREGRVVNPMEFIEARQPVARSTP